ncbi:stearoyl-CoA 9-desaturase [Ancylostoma duodenale]|uniref:Stearoyl-CoA 9-desaturase n=1 Tax=Ancylostoma duodenale TaxID=51022 RepID=A0A0C2E168_9BILA|nr:stearoyl-CoA 9-desaturase [Ancylostoma duodenale]
MDFFFRNADATHIFHAFHEGSRKAYKQLEGLKKSSWDPSEDLEEALKLRLDKADVNISTYGISVEEEKKIVESFERLRKRVYDWGLMEAQPWYYAGKAATTLGFMFFAFYLQYCCWYFTSALSLAISWQQFGWLTHEFSHHQPTKNRKLNDMFSIIFGNLAQGFSADWWKDKHNTHHAATNLIDHDGDINLAPLFAFVPADLSRYKLPVEKFILKFIPYQHLYFTLSLPLLRFSWTTQSLLWVFAENSSEYRVYRRNALTEQSFLMAHWAWVLLQLYLLPSMGVRIMYFCVSQLLSAFLIAYVVTFSHNSVDKYPGALVLSINISIFGCIANEEFDFILKLLKYTPILTENLLLLPANSRLLNNFACLQIFTTRNMTPGPITDWLWGGLNYQIEHHLFPTMPRCNLNTCMKMVKEFCKENNLPYLVNDYFEGYALNLKQLENIAHMITSKAN